MLTFILLAPLVFSGDPSLDADVVTLLATVKNLDGLGAAGQATGSFLAKGKGGTYRVELDVETTLARHRAVRLDRVPDGTVLYLLGRRQEAQRVPVSNGSVNTSYTLPERLVQIQALVATSHFEPPVLNEEQQEKKLAWMNGALSRDRTEFQLGKTAMEAGKEFPVLWLLEMTKSDLKKGHKIIIVGRMDKDSQTIRARTVARVAKRYPRKSYEIVLPMLPDPKRRSGGERD